MGEQGVFSIISSVTDYFKCQRLFQVSDKFIGSYSGWDNDTMPDAVATFLEEAEGANDSHTYNNRGDIDWAEDLSFIGLKENSTLNTVSATWTLPVGKYSVVMGSNAPSALSLPRQGYAATFTTTAIPEPSSVLLSAAALGGWLLRRRRGTSI
jgi:hypothetical protein